MILQLFSSKLCKVLAKCCKKNCFCWPWNTKLVKKLQSYAGLCEEMNELFFKFHIILQKTVIWLNFQIVVFDTELWKIAFPKIKRKQRKKSVTILILSTYLKLSAHKNPKKLPKSSWNWFNIIVILNMNITIFDKIPQRFISRIFDEHDRIVAVGAVLEVSVRLETATPMARASPMYCCPWNMQWSTPRVLRMGTIPREHLRTITPKTTDKIWDQPWPRRTTPPPPPCQSMSPWTWPWIWTCTLGEFSFVSEESCKHFMWFSFII